MKMTTAIWVVGWFVSLVAVAAPIDLSQTKSKVEFLAVGQPAALKIRGKLQENSPVTGAIDIAKDSVKADVKLSLDNFDTGIEMRNRHMKEKYLETAKYPDAKLTLKSVPLTGDSTQPDYKYQGPFEGVLTLHGVEKPVTGTIVLASSDKKWNGSFNFDFILEDFGIEIPKYLGITVSKKVQVEANFQQ
jgi:polyisoprenoid-binding protein YceI